MSAYRRKVTDKRRAANIAAAAHSTGPRTEDGKRRAAFNSFKHGLYATQDGPIRQSFVRTGLDPAQYDHLHQELAASFEPQDAVQALLVEDLTRLYWLKNISQRAMAEWQARQTEQFQFECAKRRHEARRNELVIQDFQVSGGRWFWVDACPEKFEKVDELLDTLDGLASSAVWNNEEESGNLFPDADNRGGSGAAGSALPADNETFDQENEHNENNENDDDELNDEDDEEDEDGEKEENEEDEDKEEKKENQEEEEQQDDGPSLAEATLEDIYGRQFNWTGKCMQRLFADCAQGRAPADDPRVLRLRKLIRYEREGVQIEQRLYEQGRERTIADPLSTSDPAMQAVDRLWMDMVEQETAFDRQIATKIRLLMKLQDVAQKRARNEEDDEDPVGPVATGFSSASAASGGHDDTGPVAPSSNPAPDATPGTSAEEPSPSNAAAVAKKSGTNPKSMLNDLESADVPESGEPGNEAPDAQAAGSAASRRPNGGNA